MNRIVTFFISTQFDWLDSSLGQAVLIVCSCQVEMLKCMLYLQIEAYFRIC